MAAAGRPGWAEFRCSVSLILDGIDLLQCGHLVSVWILSMWTSMSVGVVNRRSHLLHLPPLPCFSFWCLLNIDLFIKVSSHSGQPRTVLFSTFLTIGAISICFLFTSILICSFISFSVSSSLL